ncbi:hypothetical protein SAMN04487948_101334 [Halogranum amylolyticum]|uniref:Uncharacterized protein n=1 Tax=Halogranum amylolyticum TaxID=660520 RepID=A0A1H8N5K6_9EURY|nr:hypothetical protein [Halogranum amylolyticum]SEO24961.1 hypothetical protein SAMN04487948_101334 [Halogranum amylolyticum]
MDDVDVTSSALRDGSTTADGDPDAETDARSSTRTQSVELTMSEWRLLRCALQHATTALSDQDVGARVLGDRLHSLDGRLDEQLSDGRANDDRSDDDRLGRTPASSPGDPR